MIKELDTDSAELLTLASELGDDAFLNDALDMVSDVLGQPHEPRPAIVRDDAGAITGLDYP